MNVKKEVRKNRLFFIVQMLFLLFCVAFSAYAHAAEPILFFSDLTWGPKTGWEGSDTKGAAVTIWGRNLGNAGSSSWVTVNGADISSTDMTYIAEWGAAGPARGLERITFWLNRGCMDGSGSIAVTVNGVTSNALPFTVTNGTIYFVSPDGSNSNNGLYASSRGGTNGPFKDIYMFNPGLDTYHNAGRRNPSGDGQYIVYVRGGTYSSEDTDSAAIALRGPYGGPTRQKALIGYPGETVTVNTASLTRGVIWPAAYDPYGKTNYLTVSKINAHSGNAAMRVYGDYNRVVGCTFYNYLNYAQTGIVQVTNSQHTSLYGNYLYHSGNDSMKHGYYIKTEYTGQTGSSDKSTQYTDVGWNEFYDFVASDHHGGIIFVSKSGDSQIAQYPTANTYIHDNYFHDNDMECLYVGDGVTIGDVYFYNNICANGTSSNGGMTFQNGTTNAYVFNNTFYNVAGTSSYEYWATGTGTKVHSVNNIFYAAQNKAFVKVENYYGTTLRSDHDLYFSPTGAAVPFGSGITVTNWLTGNPRFTVNGTDFQLQSGSPAIDSGTSSLPSSGISVTTDYNGVLRPQNSSYDIGAYEYGTGSSPLPTWTVTASVPGGNGSLSCNSPVTNGNTTICTATPNNGYSTSLLSGCGGSWSGGNTYTTGAITENCTVTAIFTSIPSLTISTTSLASGKTGTAYSQTLAATGGKQPYAWSVISGTLPSGVTVNSTGVISGTPSTAGTYLFTVRVADASGSSATKNFDITITSSATVPASGVTLTPNLSSPQPIGTTIIFTAMGSGGSGSYEYQFRVQLNGTWTIVRDYSSVNTWTCNTTGIAAGAYNVMVYVRNTGSSAAYEAVNSIVYSIGTTPPTISTTSLASGKTGTSYSQTLAATGGAQPYAWSIVSGSLPSGLALSSAGLISGTPVTAGTYTFTVQVTDASGLSVTKNLGMTITASPATGVTLTPNLPSPQRVGTPIMFTAKGSGGSGSYEYQFQVRINGSWTVVRAYSTADTWTSNTTGIAPGTYAIRVYVRNAGSSANYEATRRIFYTLTR